MVLFQQFKCMRWADSCVLTGLDLIHQMTPEVPGDQVTGRLVLGEV